MAQETPERYVVISQGATPWAGVAEGLDGVKETLLRILAGDPEGALLGEVGAVIASLDDPAVWAVHGAGDGRPYWHWWYGHEGGSVTVQRLTEALPAQSDAALLRTALADAVAALADCVQELRRLAGAGEGSYVFRSRSPITKIPGPGDSEGLA